LSVSDLPDWNRPFAGVAKDVRRQSMEKLAVPAGLAMATATILLFAGIKPWADMAILLVARLCRQHTVLATISSDSSGAAACCAPSFQTNLLAAMGT